MIHAATDAVNTAAAATSLINLTWGCKSGERWSIVFSTAVFSISVIHTKAIENIIAIHSIGDIFIMNENGITRTVANAWIHALCSVRKKCLNPAKANAKRLSRLCTENVSGLVIYNNLSCNSRGSAFQYYFLGRKTWIECYALRPLYHWCNIPSLPGIKEQSSGAIAAHPPHQLIVDVASA